MDNDNVIQEILRGNGIQFDVKKILIAHIHDDHENRKEDNKFKKFVCAEFKKGSGIINANKVRSVISLSLITIVLCYLLGAKLLFL